MNPVGNSEYLSANLIKDNVLSISHGFIYDALSVSSDAFTDGFITISTGTISNISTVYSNVLYSNVFSGAFSNVASVQCNTLRSDIITDGYLNIQNGSITSASLITCDRIISEALVIQNSDVQTPGNFVAQGQMVATTLTDNFMSINQGNISGVRSMTCDGVFTSNIISDGTLSDENGSLNEVQSIRCHELNVDKITSDTLVIENNDIHTMGNFITAGSFITSTGNFRTVSGRFIGAFSDDILRIEQGQLANVANIECTGTLMSSVITDGVLRVQHGSINNANVISSNVFTDGHIEIKDGYIYGIKGLAGNVATGGGSGTSDSLQSNVLSDGIIEMRNGVSS